MPTNLLDRLTSDDLAHLRQELSDRLSEEDEEGSEGEGGPEDVMTSIGYVNLWRDGDVTAHGVFLGNVEEQ